jgi:sporulation protein YlmC with PRC-barrel domain
MEKTKHTRLMELDRSEFEVVQGEPDIRGWDVRNSRGQKIGEVEELIIDVQQKKVRYMVVDLDDNELKLDHRKILLPIGLAELHKEDDDVILPNVTADHLKALPVYDKNNLNLQTETLICTTLGRKMETSSMLEGEELNPEFYRHDYYNDDNLYKHRLHELSSGEKTQLESEYERGLKLWELRSEGTVIDEKNTAQSNRRSEMTEETRMEKVQNRRRQYEVQRRGHSEKLHDDERPNKRSTSIVDRLRDEGLQDA